MCDSVTNSAEFYGINFQPMPKRFMVWDAIDKKFSKVFETFWQIAMIADYAPAANRRYAIVQSTNLFDKDGKEIFEGSIVDYNGDGNALGAVVYIDGEWQLKDKNDNLMFLKGAPHQKLVGHVLPNPELLGEKHD